MPGCSCAGQSCSCSIVAGTGTKVRGTGTAANPFKIDVDPGSLGLASAIQFSDSSTIDFTKTGTGAAADPLVVVARVLLVAPNGSKFTLGVSNAGALQAVPTT